MKTQVEKNAGVALILFIVLMLFTMILHPVGGSFEHLLQVSTRTILTHSIALLSIPFACFGFWGLTKRIGPDNFFSLSAFAMILFALVAVMLAAATNGLVLPIFIRKYQDASPDMIESIQPLLRYNFAVNNAFDYIYTGGFCLAILFWSVGILQSKTLAKATAWIGKSLTVAAAILTMVFGPGNLLGLRLFMATIVGWMLMIGILLLKPKRAGS